MIPYLSPEFIAALFPQESCQQPSDQVPTTAPASRDRKIRQQPYNPIERMDPSVKFSSISKTAKGRFSRMFHKRSERRMRLELNRMLRITLSTVDYATKSYSLGSSDIAQYAISKQEAVNFYGGNIMIMAASPKLRRMENTHISHACSAEYARTISSALFAICRNAHGISWTTIEMIEDDSYQRKESLVRIGDTMLQFLRLFTVALANESSQHLMNLRHRMDEYRFQLVRQRLQITADQLHTSQSDANADVITSNLESMVRELFTAVETSLRFIRPAA